MEKINISIINVVADKFCTEAEDGQKVFDVVYNLLKDGHKINLSFLNVEMLTTAFLNSAIGQLYREFSEETVKENLTVSDVSASGLVSLKRVVDTAKLYYSNPDALQRSINEIMED